MRKLSRKRTRYSTPVFFSFRFTGTIESAFEATCCTRNTRMALCTTGIPANFVIQVAFAPLGTPNIAAEPSTRLEHRTMTAGSWARGLLDPSIRGWQKISNARRQAYAPRRQRGGEHALHRAGDREANHTALR